MKICMYVFVSVCIIIFMCLCACVCVCARRRGTRAQRGRWLTSSSWAGQTTVSQGSHISCWNWGGVSMLSRTSLVAPSSFTAGESEHQILVSWCSFLFVQGIEVKYICTSGWHRVHSFSFCFHSWSIPSTQSKPKNNNNNNNNLFPMYAIQKYSYSFHTTNMILCVKNIASI